jgi:hypothetical protein
MKNMKNIDRSAKPLARLVFQAFFIISLLNINLNLYSQCSTPPTRVNPTILLGSGLTVGNSTSFYMYSYQYFVIENVTTGRNIRISTCGCGYDSQITLRDWSTDTYLSYNDDNGPACSGTASSLDYSGNTTYPHVKVILNQYNCTSTQTYTYGEFYNLIHC